MLEAIVFPPRLDERTVPDSVRGVVHDMHRRIEAFQDRWDVHKIEQFVAADYELVYQALEWLRETQVLIGNRFLEWGCGFAAVTLLADHLGFDAIGIESESVLLDQGKRTLADWFGKIGGENSPPTGSLKSVHPELIFGNFLPADSHELADDPTLPSLGHPVPTAYDSLGLDLDDFAIVYSYPWPGEDEFHEAVFDAHGARGAIQLHFRGPNDVRAWRKTR